MFYGSSINETRKMFFNSWLKYQSKQGLEPVEQQVVNVILDHPEYHDLLEQQANIEKAYFPEFGETNPFLHMGLHLAIREQVTTNRPSGIAPIFKNLLIQKSSKLDAEHALIDCLAESLWLAQKNKSMPSESDYLACCQKQLSKAK
tara:strand:- start:4092 stop:4529 length:438 start_codon:yes stop_codon:yes gene_type:complete